MDRTGRKTYNTVLTGVMMALAVILLYIASVIPGFELTFYAFSGLVSGIVIMEAGIKNGVMLYVGTLILAFLIVPDKAALIMYGFVFGLSGFIKYFSEKSKNMWVQLGLKVIFILAVSVVIWAFFRTLIAGQVKLPDFSEGVLLIWAVVMFLLYDYIFTLVLNVYRNKIKREKPDIKLSGK